jgi:hypothetical protein
MSNRVTARPRTDALFGRDGWELLVRLPGRVVVAATRVQAGTARRTVAEGLAGISAIAAGRGSASRLVREVVAAIYAETDDRPVAQLGDRPSGTADLLASCRSAARLLAERAGPEDHDAYRHWLEAIAARVCQAARTGGLLGLGAGLPSPAERQFLADLSGALGG